MKISIDVRVNFGGLWDPDAVSKEVKIETEHTDDPKLPWAQICAGLVEAAIIERLETAWTEEQENGN